MLGDFAVGGLVTVGVLAGVAAVAVAFDKLTASSRKAMDAADKLSASYNQMAKISALGIGGQQKADIDIINKGLEEHNKWLGFIIAARTRLGSMGGLLGADPGGHSAAIAAGVTGKAAAEQARVNAIGLQDAKDNQAWADRIKAETDKADQAAAKIMAASLAASETYWRGQTELLKRARDKVGELQEIARQYLLDNPVAKMLNAQIMGNLGPADIANVDINAGLTDEQKKTREKMGILIDDSNKNAMKLSDVISSSAIQGASIIVSALNLGGGGKGSGLGGAIGSTAGFAVGFSMGGPVGGAIGSLIGNIGGSLFGGLFDSHKKAVNNNTAAIQALTSALIYAPAGFRAESYRYSASDPKPLDKFAKYARSTAARGGANPLAQRIFG